MALINSITDIPGILVGQVEDTQALTGCSVVICKAGAVGGVSQRGGAPGTRETDLLRPMHLVEKVHAVLLAGGSAYGLDAAAGVMQFLEEKRIGLKTGAAIVPIVPAAILYDLALGNSKVRPDKQMGYQAAQKASPEKPRQGNFGAGCGATVGKMLGMGQATKSGIGTSSREITPGLIIAALVAVNAFGDVIDYENNKIIAGTRTLSKGLLKVGENKTFANTLEIMRTALGRTALSFASKHNTVIGVIATNALLSKNEANQFADSASNGIAMSIRPAFTMLDGDTVFSLAIGKKSVDINLLCAFAPLVFADAIQNAVHQAQPAGGLPSATSLKIDGSLSKEQAK